MIYYSIIYPPVVPISLPAFEVSQNKWKLYFEPSIGNKISEFKGGFIRIRSLDSDTSIFAYDKETPFLYDMVPFRNPFAEFNDPIDPSSSRLQPEGYPLEMPKIERDIAGYYIELRTDLFSINQGQFDKRFKAQIMFTSDWVSPENADGSGEIGIWIEELSGYYTINREDYFGGALVEKGLSEWSRVTLVSPVSEANYNLLFTAKSDEGGREVGIINSSVFEFVGEQISSTLDNPNFLTSYKIDIYSLRESKRESLIDTSEWIVGQTNPNLEIRWQNQMELDDKTDYEIELTIQTKWELRKSFSFKVFTSFAESLFQGKVAALNDHDKARTKIVLSAKSPLTWGPKENITVSEALFKHIDVKGDISVEQGIDLTSIKGAFAGEMIVGGITPVQHWREDDSKYFFKMIGPALSHHNPYQEEYTLYAHSYPLSYESPVEIYEEDIIINPVIKTAISGKVFESYMSDKGAIATQPTGSPPSNDFLLIRSSNGKAWFVKPNARGGLVTRRAYEYDDGSGEIEKPIYLYERHHKIMAKLNVDTEGILFMGDRFPYELGKNTRPMYVNEFRLVKKVWGLQTGRKKLVNQQTYKAFMNDFNRKLGGWDRISPSKEYYIYFATKGGQLYLYVKDIKLDLEADLSKNSVDRFNLKSAEITEMPVSNLFLITEGLNAKFLPIKDSNGAPIRYAVTVDERGTLVAEKSFVGSSTSTHIRFMSREEPPYEGEIGLTPELPEEPVEILPLPPIEVVKPPIPDPTPEDPDPEVPVDVPVVDPNEEDSRRPFPEVNIKKKY